MRQILFLTLSLLTIYGCNSKKHKEVSDTNTVEKIILENKESIDSALNFINGYVEFCNKRNQSIDIVEWANSNELVTTRFKAKLKEMVDNAYREDPELGLGYDPIFNAQDYPDEGFELDSFDSEGSYITVKGIKWKEFMVIIRTVKENNKWMIDGCGVVNTLNDTK